eukprot:gnl/TRDRNA2_/TRDRNA2_172509_c0_seq1.p1 gnl/TRDRNA2_/TRDRNA2_172509_c0~~gnl/TRDRNA2_/TRDRNA2_172509_c0_seq1.p1  ORF type:complete len:196 (-),score=44.33 gnl/TRDRNA2_/TRDRNA2_172509_c0_seq1:74-661(-)
MVDGGKASEQKDLLEEATLKAIAHCLDVLNDWRQKMKKEEQRSAKTVSEENRVTSICEALDFMEQTQSGAVAALPADSTVASSKRPEAKGAAAKQCADVVASKAADGEGADLGLEVFHWSRKDSFVQFSNSECIAMGGGNSFALYLDKDLLHGSSDHCATFNSKRLSSTQDFIISDLECWVFDDPDQMGSAQRRR